jgi:hypothetical protein
VIHFDETFLLSAQAASIRSVDKLDPVVCLITNMPLIAVVPKVSVTQKSLASLFPASWSKRVNRA